MKVALVDVDGHNFPNLALMKISAWHKKNGDQVEWYSPLFYRPERIYASKVFTFTQDYQDYAPCDPEPIKGGTGYDPMTKLPDEIENTAPDYTIYPNFQEAYGFLTRGCIRNCPWCIVPRKEGGIRVVSSLKDICKDRKHAILMDNNFLAAPEDFVKETLQFSAKENIRLDFNQGLDARLVTSKNAAMLSKAKWIRFIRFSCDTTAVMPHVKQAIALLREAGYRGAIFVYMLVQNDLEDAEKRLREIVKMGAVPFAQPYRDFTKSSKTSKAQRDFARYANLKGGKICLTTTFSEYYHR